MSRLILPIQRTSPLAFPGRSPGFDPSHIASKNVRLSAVATGANFTSLQTAKSGAPTVTGSLIDGRMGPVVQIATAGGGNHQVAMNTSSLAAPAVATFASIFEYNVDSNNQILFSNNNSAFSWFFYIASFGALSVYNGTAISSGLTPVAGVPYFAAASVNANSAYFELVRLDTGAVQSATVSGAAFSGTSTEGAYFIGNAAFSGNSFSGSIAASMYGAQFLSLQQLRQWGQDPWAFWYPRTLDLATMLSTASGGGGTAVTVDFGGAFEFTSGVRSDGLVLLEYLASVRADSVRQLEALSSVRSEGSMLPEIVAGLSSNTAAQLEFLASTRSDDLASLEMVSAFRSDVVTLMETLSGQRSDAAVAGEIIASLRADLVGPLENLGAVNVVSDGAVQIETTAAVRSDSVASLEALSSVRKDAPATLETTAGVSTQAAVSLEATAAARSESVGQVENAASFRSDAAANGETTAAVMRQSAAPAENVAGVRRDAVAPTENQGGLAVFFSAVLQLEFLGVAVQEVTDWLVRARRRGRR